ncbi:MAG: hypothetical protein IJD60_02860 [Clostridia bacterium]|nr:hypothetical protein [Clostridia bacterium]
MSDLFLIHAVGTLILVIITWTVYALCTLPDFYRRVCFWQESARDDLQHTSYFNPVVLIRWLLMVAFLSIALLFGYIALLETERNNWFTAIFAGIMNAGWTFSFGAPLYEVWDYFEKVGLTLLPGDRAWIAFISGVSPVLALCTAVTLFRLPQFWGVLLFQRKRDICIFSDLNERAQRYANALKYAHPGKSPYIVFCSDGKVDPLDTSNIVGQSLVLKQNICNLHLPDHALRRIHFYLVTDNDSMIIDQAIRLQEKYVQRGCRINCVTSASLNEHVIDQFNMNAAEKPNKNVKQEGSNQETVQPIAPTKKEETTSEILNPESNEDMKQEERDKETEYIAFNKEGEITHESLSLVKKTQTTFINVINEAIRVVYHSFYSNDPLINRVFLEKVIPKEAQENFTLEALVLGAGSLGEELARTLLWYCQLPGIRVQVTIVDKEDEDTIRGRIYRRNLCFEEYLQRIGYDSFAKLQIKPNIDLCSKELESLLGEKDYHFVFVATGRDSQNYELALRVRRYYLRKPLKWGCPDVRAVIWDDIVTNIIGHKPDIQLLKGDAKNIDYAFLCGKDAENLYHAACPVTFIGAMKDSFSAAHHLDYEALCYHAYYSGKIAKDRRPERILLSVYSEYYASGESNKRSNWDLAIHGKAKFEWYEWKLARVGKESRQEVLDALSENEHVRWCISRLLEGDCPVPEGKLDCYIGDGEKLRGRDPDSIRGFHSTLRPWKDLQNKAENCPEQRKKEFWDKMISNNGKLVEFSLILNR